MAEIVEEEKIRLLVKVSKMYYIDGLNQVEISKRLRKSRSQISRLLTMAKSEGYVQISIHDPFAEEHAIEEALIQEFDIQDVVITDTGEDVDAPHDVPLARSAAQWLGSVWQDHDVIGMMAGQTLTTVGQYLHSTIKKGMQLVPLIGGWGKEGVYWDANSNTRVFGEKLKSKVWQLNAPAIVHSKETKHRLLDEQDILDVLSWAKQSTVALVGIGQVSEQATIVKTGYMSKQDIKQVEQRGAKANICTTFLDEQGQVIDVPFDSHMIGIGADDLRKIPYVIAVASGLDKVPAIVSTLRGGWIDVLIMDRQTAEAVMNHHQQTKKEQAK